MAKQRHLKRAPITEALISFQIDDLGPARLPSMERLSTALAPEYYRKGEISTGSLEVELGQSASVRTETKQTGVRLHSHDEKYVVQATTSGLALSRLEPYEDWQRLTAEMKAVWSAYCELIRPPKVVRVAVRYINTIKLDVSSEVRLDKFLLRPPVEPAGMPERISSFLSRLVVEDDASKASVLVTMGSREPIGMTLPVTLDIEAVRTADFGPKTDILWSYLEILRSLKNAAFFGSLTEDAIGQYD